MTATVIGCLFLAFSSVAKVIEEEVTSATAKIMKTAR